MRPIRPSEVRPDLASDTRKVVGGTKRFVIELSPVLHKRLRQRAVDEERTMRDVILGALASIGVHEE